MCGKSSPEADSSHDMFLLCKRVRLRRNFGDVLRSAPQKHFCSQIATIKQAPFACKFGALVWDLSGEVGNPPPPPPGVKKMAGDPPLYRRSIARFVACERILWLSSPAHIHGQFLCGYLRIQNCILSLIFIPTRREGRRIMAKCFLSDLQLMFSSRRVPKLTRSSSLCLLYVIHVCSFDA